MEIGTETKRRARSNVESLRRRGFDLSRYLPRSGSWSVWCSQCEALVICGVPCHETGCPNKVKTDVMGED